MFYINDSGEMFMRQEALQTLNSSVLHVVATAVDSGAPPRQVSNLVESISNNWLCLYRRV